MQGSLYTTKRSDIFTFTTVTALFFAACFAALYLPSQAAGGVRSGVQYSLNVLLPSLFPFMFLSAFASEYGISSRLGRLFAPFTQGVLYLPGDAGVTVLLSLVGGYPVGAVGISSLLRHKKITQKQARRMLCCCVNPGPAFLISAVGDEMYGSKTIGVVLFASQTAASLIVGIVLGIIARFHEPIEKSSGSDSAHHDLSTAFVLSTKSACASAVSLCSLVVLFSAFSSLLLALINIDGGSLAGAGIRSFLEVTDGTACLAALRLPIYFTALAVGWGGLCVHFQVFAALTELRINKAVFALSRLAVGGLSALLSVYIMKLPVVSVAVFSAGSEVTAKFSELTFWGSLALFISSALFCVFIDPLSNLSSVMQPQSKSCI